jgi:hypothetical protein
MLGPDSQMTAYGRTVLGNVSFPIQWRRSQLRFARQPTRPASDFDVHMIFTRHRAFIDESNPVRVIGRIDFGLRPIRR